MSNQIREVFLHDQLQDTAEAAIWIQVLSEHRTPTTEVRGRFVGPHCLYASTVEVAYPLRTFGRPPPGLSVLARRVTIPEPCLWDPQSPFLYQGMIELW